MQSNLNFSSKKDLYVWLDLQVQNDPFEYIFFPTRSWLFYYGNHFFFEFFPSSLHVVVLYDLWLASFKDCVFPQMFFTLNIFFYFLFFGLECVLNFYQFIIFQVLWIWVWSVHLVCHLLVHVQKKRKTLMSKLNIPSCGVCI